MTRGPVFESERFFYRPLELTDDTLARELFTDVDVTRYVGGIQLPEAFSVAAMAKYCRRAMGGGIGIWVIVDKATGDSLGTTILWQRTPRSWLVSCTTAWTSTKTERSMRTIFLNKVGKSFGNNWESVRFER